MKSMKCSELGGACEKEFSAQTFDEIAEQSKLHGMEMFKQGDADHLKAMADMKALMNKPGAMQEWFDARRKEFDNKPED